MRRPAAHLAPVPRRRSGQRRDPAREVGIDGRSRVVAFRGLPARVQSRGARHQRADRVAMARAAGPLALAGSREDEMKLLLAHNPILLRRAARASIDLVLSGHTHGGQVAIRGERNTVKGARKRLLKGLGKLGNTQMYVNRGLGTVVLPIP